MSFFSRQSIVHCRGARNGRGRPCGTVPVRQSIVIPLFFYKLSKVDRSGGPVLTIVRGLLTIVS
jgi:hypothetical protein